MKVKRFGEKWQRLHQDLITHIIEENFPPHQYTLRTMDLLYKLIYILVTVLYR